MLNMIAHISNSAIQRTYFRRLRALVIIAAQNDTVCRSADAVP
jgi:hypothetical protein